MKIMSYIQKTIYALFLLALFSGCTDEVLDGGGNGSTTPIEEGKLVDVKFVLDQAGAKTVITRSDDDSDEPEVDDEFLFLQYKNGELVYAWYTEEDDDVYDVKDSRDNDEIEGWGARGTVKIRLLSGEGYHVYVIANLELKKSYYEQIITKGDDDDNKRGPVYITNDNFYEEFCTEEALLSWRRNSSFFVDNDDNDPDAAFEYDREDKDGIDLDDDPVMFAVASNESMGETTVYKYTKMATNPEIKGDRVNDMINFTSGVPSVSIVEGGSICATLYQPYAKVALRIVANDLKKSVKITSVEVLNCPLDYSLVNGFNLASNETDTTKYTFGFGSEDIFKDVTLSNNKVLNEYFEDYVYIFENMAGVVNSNGSNQQGKVPDGFDPNIDNNSSAYDNAANGYTYIKVRGVCEGKPITYRFILGSDSETNCNVERNVFYKVTMTLTGNAGVDEASWRVEYEGKENISNNLPDDPIVVSPSEFDLDAHATLNEINVTFNKPGHYYIISGDGNGESYHLPTVVYDLQNDNRIIVDSKLTNNESSINIDWSPGTDWNGGPGKVGRGHFEISESNLNKEYSLRFVQSSWFDHGNPEAYGEIANEGPRTRQFSFVLCNEPVYVSDHKYAGYIVKDNINKKVTVTVNQYPALVVSERARFDGYPWSGSYFVERFYEDEELKGTNELKGKLNSSHSPYSKVGQGSWNLLQNNDLTNFANIISETSGYVVVNGAPWKEFLGNISGYKSDLKADKYIEEKARYRFVPKK